MKKKRVFFASVALAVILTHSCRMPSAVEIRTDNFELSIPLIANFSFSKVIRGLLEDAFSSENGDGNGSSYNVRIFDMVNYDGAQAFLVAMELDAMLPSFNPDDYLGAIGDEDMDPIEANIVVPKIAWETTEPVEDYFDMRGLFDTMEEALNRDSMPEIKIPPHQLPFLPSDLLETIPFADLMQGQIMLPFFSETYAGNINFDYVILSNIPGVVDEDGDFFAFTNSIHLCISLANPETLPAGLTLEVRGIELIGMESGSPIPLSPNDNPKTALMGYPSFSDTVTIDISGATVKSDDPLQFRVHDVVIRYTGDPIFAPVSIGLVMQPSVDRIALRGAGGLRIGTLGPLTLPDGIAHNITMPTTEGFLNADIRAGEFMLEADIPSRRGPNETYAEGLEMRARLYLSQKPVYLDGVAEPFLGLSEPWPVIFGTSFPLAGQTINGREIEVNQSASSLHVTSSDPESGISFELFDEHYRYKRLPVTITMDMNIAELETIRWELDDDLIPISIDPIEFTNMGGTDVTEFIKSITFDRIEVVLDIAHLDGALDGNIALVIKSEYLGFYGIPRILHEGKNPISSTASKEDELALNLLKHPSIEIDVKIVPVVDEVADPHGRVLKIGPLRNMDGREEIRLNLIAEIAIDFNWTKAEIYLAGLLDEGENHLSGGIPDEPINLAETLGDFMSGFTFADGSIDISVFMDGPREVIEIIKPTFRLNAVLEEAGEGEELLDMPIDIGYIGFPPLPEEGDFEGLALPEGGLEVDADLFLELIADMPDYLRFEYELELGAGGTITVTRYMFKDDDNDDDDEYGDVGGELRVLVLIKMALDFRAYAGAYFNLPVLEDSDDLFGRDSLDDPLFGDESLTIRSLMFRLDFGGDDFIFKGAVLHLDEGSVLFPDGFPLNDGTNHVGIRITGAHMDIINDSLVPPNIRIVYPEEQYSLRITRQMSLTRLTIAASGSYRIEL